MLSELGIVLEISPLWVALVIELFGFGEGAVRKSLNPTLVKFGDIYETSVERPVQLMADVQVILACAIVFFNSGIVALSNWNPIRGSIDLLVFVSWVLVLVARATTLSSSQGRAWVRLLELLATALTVVLLDLFLTI